MNAHISKSFCRFIFFPYTLSKRRFSQSCHKRTILGSPKNLSVNTSLKTVNIFFLCEEPFSFTNNHLCNGTVPRMLKVLHGTINKSPQKTIFNSISMCSSYVYNRLFQAFVDLSSPCFISFSVEA